MADIITRWDTSRGVGDWVPTAANQVIWTDEDGNSVTDEDGLPVNSIFTAGGDLLGGDDLMTAVIISLFTDAAAAPDDVIADGSDDPRGWWGGPIGSKLWLRARAKQTDLTLALVKRDIEDALAWLVEDDIAASVEVMTEWVRPAMLGALVIIRRADGARRALAFSTAWSTS